VNIYQSAEEACRAAATAVVAAAREAIAERGRFLLVLSGGSTPKRLYQLLAGPLMRSEVDWSRVEFFWGDERAVPPDHPDSNYRLAHEALLGPLDIGERQIHRLGGEASDLDAAAHEYQNEIARVTGTTQHGEPPGFDLVLLGLGPDAHTASLFPATPALMETRRWVVSNPVLKLNTVRLTVTPMVINRSAHVFLLVTGTDKAEALAEVLEGPIDMQRLPAQLIRPARSQPVWFVDQAAAGKLTKVQQGK
jgi:6-phosphogluconolactonase